MNKKKNQKSRVEKNEEVGLMEAVSEVLIRIKNKLFSSN